MELFREDKEKVADAFIRKIMNQVKDEYPALICAVNLLKPTPVKKKMGALSTDGERLFYSPKQVAEIHRRGCEFVLKNELMHVLLHGLMGHLEIDEFYRDRKLLWVLMDLEVQSFLMALKEEQLDEYDRDETSYLKKRMGEYKGVDGYFYVKEHQDLRSYLLSMEDGLCSDDHKFWHPKKEPGENAGSGNDSAKQSKNRKEEIQCKWAMARSILTSQADDWDQMLRSVKKSHVIQNSYGTEAGEEADLIEASEENENTYYHVLMNFLKTKEDPEENPDAIDRMLYQYGLDIYGNIPLIEPPEMEEKLKLNTICIAFDSSGSCGGDTARQYLRETMHILRDIYRVSKSCEVYFFVCDARIQQEEHYESLQELDMAEWETMDIYGWGGTDFEPVFDRIRELEETEDKVIDCLIYLTDSYGSCTEEEPDYPVFFILPPDQVREDGSLEYYKQLPAWIQFAGLGEDGNG